MLTSAGVPPPDAPLPRFADLPPQGASATLTFTLEGDGVQSLDDESWAIDNVRVTLGDTPGSPGDGGS